MKMQKVLTMLTFVVICLMFTVEVHGLEIAKESFDNPPVAGDIGFDKWFFTDGNIINNRYWEYSAGAAFGASKEGTAFWYGRNVGEDSDGNGATAENPYYVQLNPVDMSGYDVKALTVRLGANPDVWSEGQFLRILLDKNNDGQNWETVAEFTTMGGDDLTDGTVSLGNTMQDITYFLPQDTSNAVVRFETYWSGYHTLAVDHVRFNGATNDVTGSIKLGNLFDDAAGTDLATALITDGFGANAEDTDLGVYQVAAGDNDGVKTIAPGIDFDFTNLGGSTAGKGIGNDTIQANDTTPLRITGQGPNNGGDSMPYGSKVEDGIGSAADGRITFDLDEIRAAGGLEGSQMTFTATGAVNDSVVGHTNPLACQFHLAAILSDDSGVIAGQVNGQDVTVGDSGSVWSVTGTIPTHYDGHDGDGDDVPDGMIAADFFLSIPATAKWLTLVSTTEVGGNYGDHSVWVDAQLNIVAIIPGDANGDGVVNHTDAEALATNWLSANATWAMGDFNDDGMVNDLDATILATNWQVTSSVAVPEPGVFVLLIGVLFGCLAWSRRAV